MNGKMLYRMGYRVKHEYEDDFPWYTRRMMRHFARRYEKRQWQREEW